MEAQLSTVPPPSRLRRTTAMRGELIRDAVVSTFLRAPPGLWRQAWPTHAGVEPGHQRIPTLEEFAEAVDRLRHC